MVISVNTHHTNKKGTKLKLEKYRPEIYQTIVPVKSTVNKCNTVSIQYFIFRIGSDEYNDKEDKVYHFRKKIPGYRQLQNSANNAKFVYMKNGILFGAGDVGAITADKWKKDGLYARIKNYSEFKNSVAFEDVKSLFRINNMAGINRINKTSYNKILELSSKKKILASFKKTINEFDNYYNSNFNTIISTNYVRKAASTGYWFSFYQNKINDYIDDFGDNFNLILRGSSNIKDDYYIIPFKAVKHLFNKTTISQDKKTSTTSPRWVGGIHHNEFKINNTYRKYRVDVSTFHGNLDLIINQKKDTNSPRSEKKTRNYKKPLNNTGKNVDDKDVIILGDKCQVINY